VWLPTSRREQVAAAPRAPSSRAGRAAELAPVAEHLRPGSSLRQREQRDEVVLAVDAGPPHSCRQAIPSEAACVRSARCASRRCDSGSPAKAALRTTACSSSRTQPLSERISGVRASSALEATALWQSVRAR
jgi:hypothetical protein